MQGNIVIYSLVALTSTAYILPNYEEAFSSKRLCENPSDNELPTYSRSQKVVAATSEKNSSYNKGGARHDEIHLLKQRGQLDGQEDRYSIFTGDRDLFKVRKMFDNSNEERHQSKSYDEKWKNEEEADGIKSYTYYAEGSGPNVVYKRGFYHTETYEDNNRKSRQNKDASRSAYRSSRRHLSNDRQSERRTHSRISTGHKKFGETFHYDRKRSGNSSSYSSAWVNSGQISKRNIDDNFRPCSFGTTSSSTPELVLG